MIAQCYRLGVRTTTIVVAGLTASEVVELVDRIVVAIGNGFHVIVASENSPELLDYDHTPGVFLASSLASELNILHRLTYV